MKFSHKQHEKNYLERLISSIAYFSIILLVIGKYLPDTSEFTWNPLVKHYKCEIFSCDYTFISDIKLLPVLGFCLDSVIDVQAPNQVQLVAPSSMQFEIWYHSLHLIWSFSTYIMNYKFIHLSSQLCVYHGHHIVSDCHDFWEFESGFCLCRLRR